MNRSQVDDTNNKSVKNRSRTSGIGGESRGRQQQHHLSAMNDNIAGQIGDGNVPVGTPGTLTPAAVAMAAGDGEDATTRMQPYGVHDVNQLRQGNDTFTDYNSSIVGANSMIGASRSQHSAVVGMNSGTGEDRSMMTNRTGMAYGMMMGRSNQPRNRTQTMEDSGSVIDPIDDGYVDAGVGPRVTDFSRGASVLGTSMSSSMRDNSFPVSGSNNIMDMSMARNDGFAYRQQMSLGYGMGGKQNFGGTSTGHGVDVSVGSAMTPDEEEDLFLNLLYARRQRARTVANINNNSNNVETRSNNMMMGGMMGLGGSLGGGLDLGMNSSQGSSIRMSRGIGNDSSLRSVMPFAGMPSLYSDSPLDFSIRHGGRSTAGSQYSAMNDFHQQHSSAGTSSVHSGAGASLASAEMMGIANQNALSGQQERRQQQRFQGAMLGSTSDRFSQSNQLIDGMMSTSSRYNTFRQQQLASSQGSGSVFSQSMALDGSNRDAMNRMMMMQQYNNAQNFHGNAASDMTPLNQQQVSVNCMPRIFPSHQQHSGLIGHLGSRASLASNRQSQHSSMIDQDVSQQMAQSPGGKMMAARSNQDMPSSNQQGSLSLIPGGVSGDKFGQAGTNRVVQARGQQQVDPVIPEAANKDVGQPTAPNASKKAHKKKPVDMPRRPLSAYNLFFSEERERILADMEGTRKQEQAAGYVVEAKADMDDGDPHEKNEKDSQEKKSASSKVTAGKPKALLRSLIPAEKKRRPHRKTHGKISFQQLARMVGERWKALAPSERQYYQNLAMEDMKRQKIAMEEYNEKRKKKSTSLTKSNISDDHDDSNSISSLEKIPHEIKKKSTDVVVGERKASDDSSNKRKKKVVDDPTERKVDGKSATAGSSTNNNQSSYGNDGTKKNVKGPTSATTSTNDVGVAVASAAPQGTLGDVVGGT